MNLIKKIILFLFTLFVIIQCTEIYSPNIDTKQKALVVEGLISDGTGPFKVKLTEAVAFSYDSMWVVKYVLKAKLQVIDKANNTFNLIEEGLGVYVLPPSFNGIIGNSYKLRIETVDGDIYESNSQELLPPQSYDSISLFYTSKPYLNSRKELRMATGVELLVDLFKDVSNTDSVPLCRFDPNMTVQLTYPYYIKDTTNWHWEKNDWESFAINGNENITPEKPLTSSALIKNYSLGFAPNKMSSYGLGADSLIDSYMYLRVRHYTLNRETYLFYKAANAQLETTGKIFDPITSQLNGNLKCINNPSKIVLGLFEVSSAVKRAYLLKTDPYRNKIWLEEVPYAEVPLFGQVKYKIWDNKLMPKPENDSDYIKEMPYWWFHN